jgi:hypothetical protein
MQIFCPQQTRWISAGHDSFPPLTGAQIQEFSATLSAALGDTGDQYLVRHVLTLAEHQPAALLD